MEKKDKKQKEEEEEEVEEVEEEEEVEEVEDQIGEDFSKDPRAFSFLQDAGMIADKALQNLISKCKPGENLYELCSQSDLFIKEELSKIYTKKKFIKGLAFPTCISLNEVCGNYSAPLDITDDPHEYKILSEGDVAKLNLGVEINGFASIVGHTIVISNNENDKIKGPKADVILAAYNSIQASLRLMKVNGPTNNDLTEAISKICKDYNVNPVEGVLSRKKILLMEWKL